MLDLLEKRAVECPGALVELKGVLRRHIYSTGSPYQDLKVGMGDGKVGLVNEILGMFPGMAFIDAGGKSPFQISICKGVREVVTHFKTVEIPPEELEGGLFFAAQKWDQKTVNALLGFGYIPPIFEAVFVNDLGKLEELLKDSLLQVDLDGFCGYTPLLRAAELGRIEIVSLLLSKGADISRNAQGATSLHLCLRGCFDPPCRSATMRCLLENGAQVNHRDEMGRTALMDAAMLDRVEEVGLLLEFGASKDLKDDQGRTAREYADESGGEAISFFK